MWLLLQCTGVCLPVVQAARCVTCDIIVVIVVDFSCIAGYTIDG
jgi:hypothetical protein